MKKIAFSLLFNVMVLGTLYGQCDVPGPAGLSCATAPILCDETLDGFCSSLPNNNSGGDPGPFCGVIENSNWIKFVAIKTEMILQIEPSNCNGNANSGGMQGQIFFTDDCNNYTSVSNCHNVNGVQTFTLTATNLILGEIYTILLDGKGGDVCDFAITMLDAIPEMANAGTAPFLCPDETVNLDGTESASGFNIEYNWTTMDGQIISGANTNNPEIDQEGTYILEVIETQANCSFFDTVTVVLADPPIAQIAPPDILNCITNSIITLDGTSSTIFPDVAVSWEDISGDPLSSTDLTQEITDPGTYVLILTDMVTGCEDRDTTTVVADLDTPIANAGLNAELNCVVKEIMLDGFDSSLGPNFTYSWTTSNGNIVSGANSIQPIIDAPGTYELLVANTENGCESTDEVIITLNELVPEGADLNINRPCFGELTGDIIVNSVISGNPPFAYSIDTALFVTSPDFNSIEIGEYILTIRDDIGCEWDTIINIFPLDEFQLDLGLDAEICLGDSIQIKTQTNRKEEEIVSYEWRPVTGLSCIDCLQPVTSTQESIIYDLLLTDLEGCTATDQIVILVDERPKVYFPNIFSPNEDGVNDFFYIQSGPGVAEVTSFQVFSRWGSLVHEQRNFAPNDPNFGWDGLLNGKSLDPAVYVYKATVTLLDGRVEYYQGDVVLAK